MGSRLVSFVVWAAVAATAVFWGLRLVASPLRAPEHAVTVGQDTPLGGDLTRLLGAAPPPPAKAAAAAPADNRFRLVGVVAERGDAPASGLALISVDGRPPKAYGLGATVDGLTVVLAVRHRAVELGPRGGPAQSTLELATLPEAARGNLPPPATAYGATAPVPQPPAVQPLGMPQPPPAMQPAQPVPVPPPNGGAPVPGSGSPTAPNASLAAPGGQATAAVVSPSGVTMLR
jgi:general secretion pathway protein C